MKMFQENTSRVQCINARKKGVSLLITVKLYTVILCWHTRLQLFMSSYHTWRLNRSGDWPYISPEDSSIKYYQVFQPHTWHLVTSGFSWKHRVTKKHLAFLICSSPIKRRQLAFLSNFSNAMAFCFCSIRKTVFRQQALEQRLPQTIKFNTSKKITCDWITGLGNSRRFLMSSNILGLSYDAYSAMEIYFCIYTHIEIFIYTHTPQYTYTELGKIFIQNLQPIFKEIKIKPWKHTKHMHHIKLCSQKKNSQVPTSINSWQVAKYSHILANYISDSSAEKSTLLTTLSVRPVHVCIVLPQI